VVWYCPDTVSKELALRLADRGVPIVGLSDGGLSAIHCQYEIDRQAAIRSILIEWKKRGIAFIKIGVGARRSTADEERTSLAVRDLDLNIEFIAIGIQGMGRFVESLAGDPTCGTMLLHSAASLLATRAPEALVGLTKSSRIALVDGPVSFPLAKLSDGLVDMLIVDWQAVAKRIVADLLKQKLPDRHHPFVFDAAAFYRVPLSGYAEKF
jgi:hypothetical protein